MLNQSDTGTRTPNETLEHVREGTGSQDNLLRCQSHKNDWRAEKTSFQWEILDSHTLIKHYCRITSYCVSAEPLSPSVYTTLVCGQYKAVQVSLALLKKEDLISLLYQETILRNHLITWIHLICERLWGEMSEYQITHWEKQAIAGT